MEILFIQMMYKTLMTGFVLQGPDAVRYGFK